jgi:ABC-type antimicrobial peptide transport system permease subunit
MDALVGKALRSRRVRFWLATAGIATSTLLVLVLVAAYRSVRASVTGYAGQPGIDLWVAPVGTDNLIRSSSLFSSRLADSVGALPSVGAAAPVVRAFLTVRGGRGDDRRRLTLLGIGYPAPNGLGGPPRFAGGRAPHGLHEVALDRAAAHILRVGIRDTVWVNGRAAVVSGLTAQTNLLATQFVFGDIGAAGPASGIAGKASFLAVRLTPGANADAVARTIMEQFPDVVAFSRAAFVANNLREVSAGFLPLLALLGILGVSAATVLVTVLLYSLVEDRRAEMAVLLALGAEATLVGRGVVRQAAKLVTLGGLLGVALAVGLGWSLDRVLPTVPLTFAASDVAEVLVVFIVFGIGAAVVPVVRLHRIDPLEAFRP